MTGLGRRTVLAPRLRRCCSRSAPAGRRRRRRSRSACSPRWRAPSRSLGQDGMRGAELALKEHNGMAGGKKIEIINGSSDATPDIAVNATRKLVEQDKVADHGRPAVRRRGHRGQGLRQDAAAGDLHQRHLGRPGHHAGQSRAQLLPLQHRRRAVDGRPGQYAYWTRATRR